MGLETSGPLLLPEVKFSSEVTGLNFLEGGQWEHHQNPWMKGSVNY